MSRALTRKLVRDFFALRAQVLAASLLLSSGVAIWIASWSAYRSLAEARESFYRSHDFSEVFADLHRAPLGLRSAIEAIPGVRALDLRIVMEGRVDLGFPANGRFISLPSGPPPLLNRIHLRSGHLPRDTGEGELEVAVHEAFALANRLHPGDLLSFLIEGRRERARITGIGISPESVASVSPALPLPDDLHFGIFWMARGGLERMAKMSGAFNEVVLALQPKTRISRAEVMERLDRILQPYGGRRAVGRERQPSDRFLTDEMREQRGMAVLAPAFFLGMSGFLIHTLCSRLIARHRAQIAALKAMGYSRGAVLRHYLALSLLLTLGGVVLGVGLGIAFGKFYAWSYSGFFRFPEILFRLQPEAVAGGVLAGVLPGILGGAASVRAAYRLPAAEAMRPPPPPEFQTRLLPRFPWEKRLSPRGKMLWRNFFFRPWRSFFSVLGLAFAVAGVVMTASFSDIIDAALKTQFERIQREDVGVLFRTPQPVSTIRILSGWPGVWQAEGRRVVPVRMRYRNHERELALTARSEDSVLSSEIDSRGRSIPLPSTGVRVSRWFERTWGMRRGSLAEFEVLEGAPRRLRIPVSDFSDDVLGLHAAIRSEELARRLGEEPAFNHVLLRTDPSRGEAIHRRLQDLPAVGSVQGKTELYRGFQATIGGVMRTLSLILTGFGLAIAGSIAHQSVRVTFSERAWEAVTLRVLGFPRSQVFGLLIGGLWIEVLLSILPGFWLGREFSRAVIGTSNAESFGFPFLLRPETYGLGAWVVLGAFGMSALWARSLLWKASLTESLKARE